MEGRPYQPVIQHFSHHHPLELSNLQQSHAPTTCAGCKLFPSGWTYACRACNYYLHATCAQMPEHISHPAHPDHALSLLPVPAYPDGCFDCDACGGNGTGFSYRCGTCGLDFHTLCVSMPPSLTHKDHPHPLTLAFSLPRRYIMGFTCDVCGGKGSKPWLYRCALCEFDVHIGCATDRAKQPQLGRSPIQTLLDGGGRGSGGSGHGVHGDYWNSAPDGNSSINIGATFGGGGSSDGSPY